MRRIIIAALSVAVLAGGAAAQVDPFNLARNRLQSYQNAEALEIIDSGSST